MNGMALIHIASLDCLILHELDLSFLVFLFRVFNTGYESEK